MREKQEALFRSDRVRGELIGEINALGGAIDVMRWMLLQYEEQDAKA